MIEDLSGIVLILLKIEAPELNIKLFLPTPYGLATDNLLLPNVQNLGERDKEYSVEWMVNTNQSQTSKTRNKQCLKVAKNTYPFPNTIRLFTTEEEYFYENI